jgi:hypothetical protein
MRNAKIVFQCITGLFFIGLLSIGIGGTYLQLNPEKAAAYALGSMTVDPKAGYFEQAMQMISGYSSVNSEMDKARAELADLRNLSDEDLQQRREEFIEERYGPLGESDQSAEYSANIDNSYESSPDSSSDSSYEGE